MEQSYEILAVDDDAAIVNILETTLTQAGYRVRTARDGDEACRLAEMQKPHLIIMDVMMPRCSGLLAHYAHPAALPCPSSCSRQGGGVRPGLGPGSRGGRLSGEALLSAGIAGPVKACCGAMMPWGPSGRPTRKAGSRWETLPWTWTPSSCWSGGCGPGNAYGVRNSQMLLANPGHVFSSEEIYSRVWDREAYAVENTVMVHISRIREKLEVNPKKPEYLKVVWGIGYVLEAL